MARINPLIIETAIRVDFVRRDPLVIVAAKRAAADVKQAGCSVGVLMREVGQSWVRSGRGARFAHGRFAA